MRPTNMSLALLNAVVKSHSVTLKQGQVVPASDQKWIKRFIANAEDRVGMVNDQKRGKK